MSRLLPILLFVFTLGFFLFAEREKAEKRSTGDKKVIQVWCTDVPAHTVKQLAPLFEQNNPGYSVHVQTVAWTSLQEKTLWAVASNSNVPDLILGSSEWTGGLANNGALEPLNKYLSEDFFAQFFKSALGTYQYPLINRDDPEFRGEYHQYGIPLDLDLMMIFYRADIVDPKLAELGMTAFPETWADFEKLGKSLYRAESPLGYPQHFTYIDPEDPVPLRMAFLPASGGVVFNRGLTEVTFDSPEAIAAFDFMGSLIKENAAKEWNVNTQGKPIDLIKSERIFANISGPWFARKLETEAVEQAGKWRVAKFPKRKPEYRTTGLGGTCLAMPYNAANKAGAVEFIKFLTSDTFALTYFQKVGSPPPIKHVWDSPEFDQPAPYFGNQQLYQVVRAAIEDSEPLQLMPSAQIMKQHVRQALFEITVNDGNTTEILKSAVKKANESLTRH